MDTRVYAASFSNAEIPWVQAIKYKPIVTYDNFRHCRVHFYAFVRQPFSKQVYMFRYKSHRRQISFTIP